MPIKRNTKLDTALRLLKQIAKKEKIHPSQVTKSKLLSATNDVSDWDLRNLGGLALIRSKYFPLEDKDLALIQANRDSAAYVRQLEKRLAKQTNIRNDILTAVETAILSLDVTPVDLSLIHI